MINKFHKAPIGTSVNANLLMKEHKCSCLPKNLKTMFLTDIVTIKLWLKY